MDRNFEQFGKRLKDYEEQPPKELWEKIDRRVSSGRNPYLVGAIVAASLCLIGFVGVMLFTPVRPENDKDIAVQDKVRTQTPKEDIEIRKEKNLFREEKIETRKENIAVERVRTEPEVLGEEVKVTLSEELANNMQSVVAKPVVKVDKISETKTAKPVAKAEGTKTEENGADAAVNVADKSPQTPEEELNRMVLFIPNAFTPSESTNNIFKPAQAEVSDYRMEIYNRQGVMVFASNEISCGWDGKYDGSLCLQGAYYYFVRFKDMKGMQHTQKGTLMLIK